MFFGKKCTRTIAMILALMIPLFMIISLNDNVYASAYDSQYEGLDEEVSGGSGSSSGGGGWVSDDPAGIYNGKEPQKVDKDLDYKAKFPETWIIVILKAPGAALEGLYNIMGITMDQVVYGRVSPNGSAINYFKFELVKGNFYGAVGSFIYNIFRMISLFFVWGIFGGRLLKMLIVSNSSKIREEFKESISTLIVSTLLLFLMPYIWQFINYIFDVLLFIMNEMQGVICPVSDVSFADFKGNTAAQANAILNLISGKKTFTHGINAIFSAMADQSMIGALCYSGMHLITLYFVYSYICVALGMFIYYIMFPFVCIISYMDKNVLSNWFKNVLAGMFVPVIDAILLMLPAAAFIYLRGVNIIFCGILTLFLCVLVIPSRNTVKNVLGINLGGVGSIGKVGLGALALLQGAKAIVSGVSSIRRHSQNAKNARREADMYDELATLEEGGGAGAGSGNVVYGNFNRNQIGAGGSTGNDFVPSAEKMNNANVEFGQFRTNSGEESAYGGYAPTSPSMMPGYASGDYKVASDYANMAASEAGYKAKASRADAEMAKINMGDASGIMRDIESKYGSNTDVGSWAEEDQQMYHAASDSYKTGEVAYTDAVAQAQNYEIAQSGYKMAASQINYDQSSQAAIVARKRQEIMDRGAGINTIGTPMFNNLSSKRKAELMRQYAKKEKRVAVRGGIALGTSGVIGASAATFMGANTGVTAVAVGSILADSGNVR